MALDVQDDKFIHLTNHCIAAKHPDFGKFEATNEMFYQEFSAYLQEEVSTYLWKSQNQSSLDSQGCR
jgi:hypothetical protein